MLQFRHAITPFYWRRGPTSLYKGQNIIDQSTIISVPFMEDPDDPDDYTSKYYAQARQLASSTFTSDGINAIKVRSNDARRFAWSSLFADWHRIESDPRSFCKRKVISTNKFHEKPSKKNCPQPECEDILCRPIPSHQRYSQRLEARKHPDQGR